ncbi:unnamed protein product [Calypogeia fissa]
MGDLIWKDLQKFEDDIFQETTRIRNVILSVCVFVGFMIFAQIAAPAIWKHFSLRVYDLFGLGDLSLHGDGAHDIWEEELAYLGYPRRMTSTCSSSS